MSTEDWKYYSRPKIMKTIFERQIWFSGYYCRSKQKDCVSAYIIGNKLWRDDQELSSINV